MVNSNVSSPTFNIINEYTNHNNEHFFHFDLYRVKSRNELFEIGFNEYINSAHYCFIEWPELSKSFIDKTSDCFSQSKEWAIKNPV